MTSASGYSSLTDIIVDNAPEGSTRNPTGDDQLLKHASPGYGYGSFQTVPKRSEA